MDAPTAKNQTLFNNHTVKHHNVPNCVVGEAFNVVADYACARTDDSCSVDLRATRAAVCRARRPRSIFFQCCVGPWRSSHVRFCSVVRVAGAAVQDDRLRTSWEAALRGEPVEIAINGLDWAVAGWDSIHIQGVRRSAIVSSQLVGL